MADMMTVRAPRELKDLIQSEAERMGISVNALVLHILWEWVKMRNKTESSEKHV